MLNIEEIRKELGDYAFKADDNINYCMRQIVEQYCIKHFGRIPYMNQLTDDVYEFPSMHPYSSEDDDYEDIPVYDDDCTDEELREKHADIDLDKTLEEIMKAYPDTIRYHINAGKISEGILFNEEFIYFTGIFYMDTPELPQKIKDCIVNKEVKPRIRWILKTGQGRIQNKYMDITPKGEIEGNYNDDFYPVSDKITELIHKDESSIIILHGKPGTGKTSYIRDLINENKDIKFYWVDSSMFNYIDTAEFIEFIASCKNAVFILEDSEALLTSRDETHNPAMQSLLSISDGMLGDSLKLKFICTFNTDLRNIDKAILRKGRMKVKYEFKDLKVEKVREIFRKTGVDESLAKEMPLCDVYNYLEDNGADKPTRKIGF